MRPVAQSAFELMFERRVELTSHAGEASSRAQAGPTALFDKGAPRKTWLGGRGYRTCLGKGHSVTRSAWVVYGAGLWGVPIVCV